ncbi:unnamed protein product [Ambrosiozyma monospora]|uniref:Unnamed protein product n=1 Tax=Ambrosiozyma monospora TaxID=43982 RepID=A0A9W6Z1Z3_AMBMO|nr:unnamed protein product [Ambrosiozyma monospora]
MVSAGLDNAPLNFQYMVMQLTQSPHIVTKAYHEILKCYNHDVTKAWNECHVELKCAYISAIVKETLRLFTVLPMALPRQTTKDIVYQNAVIPKETTIFMNCWAGNHDEKKFIKPMEFIPERFMDLNHGCDLDDGNHHEDFGYDGGKLDESVKHLAFGIGSRMCLGNTLAFKELYVLTCKFLLMFEPLDIETPGVDGQLNPLKLNKFPESIAIEPKEAVIKLKVKNLQLLAVLDGA